MAKPASEVFRLYKTDGVPSSGAHPISKQDQLDWAAEKDQQVAALEESLTEIEDAIEDLADIGSEGIRWTPYAIRVRSTGNVNISSGLENGDTLNGVTLATGNFVFLGSQTNGATITDPITGLTNSPDNGIYEVPASGAASRASFANTAEKIAKIAFVVQAGSVGLGDCFTLPLAAEAIDLGTTGLAFAPLRKDQGFGPEVEEARGDKATIGLRFDDNELKLLRERINRIVQQRGWPAHPDAGDQAVPGTNPAFTITRASTATQVNARGLLESVDTNTIQHDHDPATGEYRGWKFDRSSTNKFLHSDDLTQTWDVHRGTIAETDGAAGPFGTLTLDKYEENTETGVHGVSQYAPTVEVGKYVTVSFFVRAAERTYCAIHIDSNEVTSSRAYFNLATGELLQVTGAGAYGGIEDWGGGLYLIWCAAITVEVGSTARGICCTNANASSSSFAGETGKGIWIGHGKFEDGIGPTSDIPTTSSTVSRAGTSVLRSVGERPEGTIFARFRWGGNRDDAERVVGVYASNSNRAHIVIDTAGKCYFGVVIGGNSETVDGPTLEEGIEYWVAASWKDGEQIIAVNGVSYVAEDPVSGDLSGSCNLVLGSTNGGSSSQFTGTIAEAWVFAKALTAEQLESVTDPTSFSSGGGEAASLTLAERTGGSGAVTDASFRAFQDFDASGEVQLVVSMHRDLIAPVFTSTAAATTTQVGAVRTYHHASVTATGLSPDTTYYFQWKFAGRFVGPIRSVRTAPPKGQPTSFPFMVVSCSRSNAGLVDDIFPAAAAYAPRFLAHLGDVVYANIEVNSLGRARDENIRPYLGSPSISYLHQTVPFISVYDNHDSGGSQGSYGYVYESGVSFEVTSANARKAFYEIGHHYPLEQERLGLETDPELMTLTQRWTWGRVRFLLLDSQTQRRHSGTATLLGHNSGHEFWDQYQWLIDQMDEYDADDDLALLVILLPETYVSKDPDDPGDSFNLNSWDHRAPLEQKAFCDHLRTINKRVMLVCGDGHEGGGDDGTFGDKSTSGKAKFPHFMSSGFLQPASASSIWGVGPFQWDGESGHVSYVNLDMRLYALFYVEDNGGDDIRFEVHFHGNPVDPVTKVPTLKRVFASDDETPAVSFADTPYSASPGGSVTVKLAKTWFGPCSVNWAASGGVGSGTATFGAQNNEIEIPLTAPGSDFTVTLSAPQGCTITGTNPVTVTVA